MLRLFNETFSMIFQTVCLVKNEDITHDPKVAAAIINSLGLFLEASSSRSSNSIILAAKAARAFVMRKIDMDK